MLVEGLLQAARERLVTLAEDSKLIDAANLLSFGAELVIVCDSDGVLQGVVTKTDIVKQISNCRGAACMWPVSAFLTRDVVLCRGSDHVEDVSDLMRQRHLKNIPVVDADNRPIGVLTARAILRALLSDAEYEEAQLVDYVKGLGYR
jgi:CBS domain-containing protein